MFLVRLLLPASIVMTVCFATFASGALELPDDEAQAIRNILRTLGKNDWDLISNPCSTPSRSNTTTLRKKNIAAVKCSNCFVNGTESYRVVGIDLSRNYLNGLIPPAWGSVKQLTDISLLGNRLTGPIPRDLAKITTLSSLTVEFNQLSGILPLELGSMSSIRKLKFSSNNFTGELPPSFANLISMQDFRINDNQFSGQIPSYISHWKNLTILFIQASGLKGPIPPLDLLGKLTDLRISDLNGSGVTFPLKNINVSQWETLILRNCNLTGPLPDQIVLPPNGTTGFQTLDLSFNSLSGEIPSSFENLNTVDHIYLTHNLLTGPIPRWILDSTKAIDLSYNKFTNITEGLESSSHSCQLGKGINLFTSSLMDNEASNIVSCLRSSHCPKKAYKLHINCGGKKEIVNKSIEFRADDTNQGGPSNFFLAQDWSSSSTGQFMNDDRPIRAYILSINSSKLSKDTTNPELYTTARFSPLSLTYYAFCLVSGKYRVRLHFAEIVFIDDETYSSLGRRVFDVYIQGERRLKDFDIVKAAGGVRKPNIQSLDAVVTNSGTLEIRFYWAGKGTTDIPSKGDYGPLISAISVDSYPSGGISVFKQQILTMQSIRT